MNQIDIINRAREHGALTDVVAMGRHDGVLLTPLELELLVKSILDEHTTALLNENSALRAHIEHVHGCVRAAQIEGLGEALNETPDERLKDLVERRLLHVVEFSPEPESQVSRERAPG